MRIDSALRMAIDSLQRAQGQPPSNYSYVMDQISRAREYLDNVEARIDQDASDRDLLSPEDEEAYQSWLDVGGVPKGGAPAFEEDTNYVLQVADMLTDDPNEVLVTKPDRSPESQSNLLTEDILRQYQDFWGWMQKWSRHLGIPAPAIENQDMDMLVSHLDMQSLEDLLQEIEGMNMDHVAQDIRRKAGIAGEDNAYWTGANRPGVWGGDY